MDMSGNFTAVRKKLSGKLFIV